MDLCGALCGTYDVPNLGIASLYMRGAQWDLPPTIKIAWQADGSSVENGQV